jgi:hypothetical protein
LKNENQFCKLWFITNAMLGTPYTVQWQAALTNTTSPLGTLGSVASLWAATLYQVKKITFEFTSSRILDQLADIIL